MKRLVLFSVIFVILLIGCGQSTAYKNVERSRFLMDTLVKISIYDQDVSEKVIDGAISKAFLLMDSLEKITSLY